MLQLLPQRKYSYYRIYSFIAVLLLSVVSAQAQLSFTNQAAAKNLHIGTSAKDGGFTWADFNNDGNKDLLINTNNGTAKSRLLYSNGAPNFTFTDVTASKAPALLSNLTERSAIAGDIDNDGDIDFVRNTHSLIEVYKNSGAPNYTFTKSQYFDAAYFIGTGTQTGLNSEGMGFMDFDGDGDLDLFIEDHEYGVEIMINDGTGFYTHYTTDASPKGFGTTGVSGDYSLVADLNNDGYVDILARREGTGNTNSQSDIFMNNGNGTFTANYSVNLNASNGNKGGVAVGDFDGDGDFDYFWTDNGGTSGAANNCYLVQQTGTNSGVFAVATVAVTGSSTALPSAGLIDGVTVGDVNHDGKLDIFLTANSGPSFLLINTSTGAGVFSFNHNNYGINVNADGEGCEFVDFDNDGDLDLYININGGNNQLWINALNDSNYVNVIPLIDLGEGLTRPAIGATVVIRNCVGTRISPIMEVSGGSGHGTQQSSIIHFGLPSGSLMVYYAEVSFVKPNGGSRTVVAKQVFLGLLPTQTITIIDTEATGPLSCSILSSPGLVNFTANYSGEKTIVNWEVNDAVSYDSYEVEYSKQTDNFKTASSLADNKSSNYSYTHQINNQGIIFYRLKLTHKDKSISYSSIVKVNTSERNINVEQPYPNPFTDKLSVPVNLNKAESVTVQVIDIAGKILKTETVKAAQGNNVITINDLTGLSKGFYFIKLIIDDKTIIKRVAK